MSDFQDEHDDTREVYPIGKFTLVYFAALGITIIGFLTIGLAFVFGYIIIGMLVMRYISRRVIWHVFQVSIADIAATKVLTWFTWPLSVPVLIVQIFIAERL